MKYKKYLLERKNIPRTTQHRWRRQSHHVGVSGQQNSFADMSQDIATQQNQTSESEDQNPFVTSRHAETFSQIIADVEEKQENLDAPDGFLQAFADVDEKPDDLDASDDSLQQQVKESTIPHDSSILHSKVEVQQNMTDYVEESSDEIQQGEGITGDEIMEKTPSNESHVPPLWAVPEYSEKALHEQQRNEHELLLLALKCKHGLTDEALEDIFKVINVITGEHSVSTSKHHFYKNMSDYKDYIVIKHFCSDCTLLMEEKDESVGCRICGKEVDAKKHMTSGNFFIVLPLEAQLRNIIEQHKLPQMTVNKKDSVNAHLINDVYDGLLYKKTLDAFTPLNDCPNFSITFSCDGVPLFKSSSQSIWPLLCTLNELPPNLRSDNIMLTALWFGAKKPPMNIFLEPFVKECIDLHDRGFDWVTSDGVSGTSKVYALILVSDSVARPLLQNFKQFNGEFGCSFCPLLRNPC
ncbi:uncharacterized protein LOC130421266 [Triplophysa dalaica]|uniref:uncharacterized protein LOC130421266 n=1 Tax=Triplophysa dalaica TaxID=1582913 RepID=UPI0024DFAB9C|nr:uncharacterized protein LOC130421266 [Triplophysa dalaica]